MAAILTLLIVVNLAFLSVVVLVLFPRWLRNLAVYRLWRLRDGIWEAIHGGIVDDTQDARVLIELIDRAILYLPMLSLTRMLPLQLAIRGTIPEIYHAMEDLSQMTTARRLTASNVQPQVRDARAKLLSILRMHTTFGWAVTVWSWFRSPQSEADLAFINLLEAAASVQVGHRAFFTAANSI